MKAGTPPSMLLIGFLYPRSRRFITIDFGYNNPFVAQWWALSGDGVLYRYREIYVTKRLVMDLGGRSASLS